MKAQISDWSRFIHNCTATRASAELSNTQIIFFSGYIMCSCSSFVYLKNLQLLQQSTAAHIRIIVLFWCLLNHLIAPKLNWLHECQNSTGYPSLWRGGCLVWLELQWKRWEDGTKSESLMCRLNYFFIILLFFSFHRLLATGCFLLKSTLGIIIS